MAEDGDWLSSNIKGFSFGDDDETPFEELANYSKVASGSISGAAAATASSSSSRLSTLNEPPGGLNPFERGDPGSQKVVSDRVRAASAAYAARLDRQDRSILEILGSSEFSQASLSADPVLLSTDVKTLRSELLQVRKQLEKIQLARFMPLHPKETVACIFLGQPFSLEFYKSWADKVALIDEAIELGDGNSILTVTLFLRKTLSTSKLAEVLIQRPAAAHQLAAYLRQKADFSGLSDLYASIGQYDSAAVAQYESVLLSRKTSPAGSPDAFIRRLKGLLTSHFSQGTTDSSHIVEHINLLERAIALTALGRAEGLQQLTNLTVQKLLAHCAGDYYDTPENLLQSPLAIKKCHKLSEREYVWGCLEGRAFKANWKDCEDLLLAKGWLGIGGRKIKPDFSPLDVARFLHGKGSPADKLNVYIPMIDPIEDREKFAKKVGAHTAVVDIYVFQRDRLALQNYKLKLVPQTEEWWYAENALNSGTSRWKN